jgi:hypothetical protein
VAFAVFYSRPKAEGRLGGAHPGKKLPLWAQFDRDLTKVETMIRLNFESARLTHPACRLVILTDLNTTLALDKIDPGVPG